MTSIFGQPGQNVNLQKILIQHIEREFLQNNCILSLYQTITHKDILEYIENSLKNVKNP